MELKFTIDSDELHNIIVTSLKEYYEYLSKEVWFVDDDIRLSKVKAFELVLEDYMSHSEYSKYMQGR